MGSLTVRNLPEAIKKRLRLRAAANGRSMEEEVRLLLAEGAAAEMPAAEATPAPKPTRAAGPAAKGESAARILLIIAGGIAAYKSLDLIRRLRERGYAVRVVMTRAAQEFVTPVRSGERARRRPHPPRARRRPDRGRAGNRRHHGEDGARARRRSRDRRAARDPQPDPARAGDERRDVGAQGDSTQFTAADRRRHRDHRAERGRDGGERRSGARTHGRAAGDRCRGRAAARRPAAITRQAAPQIRRA